MNPELIIHAIDTAPLNRGLRGADWLASAGNVPVTFENGDVILFDHESDAVYQIHLLLRSSGRQAIQRIKEASRQMFVNHGAEVIFGLVPDFRRDVKLIGRWAGYKFAGKRKTRDGLCELYVLSRTAFFKGYLQ